RPTELEPERRKLRDDHDGVRFAAGAARRESALVAPILSIERANPSARSIENGPFGIHPFFYASEVDALRASTSIRALLAAGVSPRLDDGALAVFLRT